MLSGRETCLCCISVSGHSRPNTSQGLSLSQSSASVKGIARLENMIKKLISKSGISKFGKELPKTINKNPSARQSLVPSWFTFKDWNIMENDMDLLDELKLKNSVGIL